MIQICQYRKGFTLVEVLIAMAIIGVGLIALITLFPVGLRSSRLAGDFTTASFVAQQALDNIRAGAQVYDPADLRDEDGDGNLFDDPNGDGLGYYELPVSAVKFNYGDPDYSRIRLDFPDPPKQSQWWKISITSVDTGADITNFSVINSIYGAYSGGTVGLVYTADDKSIRFLIRDNEDGPDFTTVVPAPDTDPDEPEKHRDRDYDEFEVGDKIVIHVEMHGGNPYYWFATRAPVTEDVDLDGLLDGRLPSGTVRSAPHNQVQEDIGLDFVPDFYDTNRDGSYQAGLDRRGEFSVDVDFPADPHGDNYYPYDVGTGWWNMGAVINPRGTEGNGRIDAFDDDEMQRVTVVVGWREGGRDRHRSFSTIIPNQFR